MAWSANRILALVLGIVFVVLGIVGLALGLNGENAFLLGFQVDLVHNLVHLVTGIIALAAVFTGWSRTYNRIFGIVYILLGLAGLIPALYLGDPMRHALLGIMAVNPADNLLNLVAGVVAALVGFFVTEPGYRTRTTG